MRLTRAQVLFLSLCILMSGCAIVHSPSGSAMSDGHLPGHGSPYGDLDALEEGVILHVATGRELTEAELLDLASSARILYVGEMHTNMEHHRVQLTLLKAMNERFPGGIAVGMEMFQRPSQPSLNQWSQGTLDTKAFKRVWYDDWGEEYGFYEPILDYIREQQIPLVALNVSDEHARTLSGEGWDGLPEPFREWLGGIDREDPYHRQSMEAIFGAHAHGGASGFDRFYQRMLLWDETMAQSAADFLQSHRGKGKKLLVFAGGFHIEYGYGIPKRLFRRLPEPYLIVMPHTASELIPEEFLMDVAPAKLPLYLADVAWVTGYSETGVQRIRLGVRLDPGLGGALVTWVAPGSPAAKAGVQPGDQIASLNNERVNHAFDIITRLRMMEPGDTATLTLKRGDDTLDVTVQF